MAALASLLLLAGCSQTSPNSGGSANAPGSSSATSSADSVNSGSTPAADGVPSNAAYRNDGFAYGGFSKPGSQTFLVKVTGQSDSESVQTTTLKTHDEGSATYERTRDGALAAVGSDVVKVNAKGVLVISVSIGKLDKPSLELPANLSPGVKWISSSTITTDTDKIKSSGTYTVIGDVPIKIAAGAFTARKIVFTGSTETSKGQGIAKGTYWFVKDLGAVKTEMTQTMQGQAAQTFVLELKK